MKQKCIALGMLFLLVVFFILPGAALAQDDPTEEEQDAIDENTKYIAIGALIAMGMSGILSAVALGLTGSSAVGVVSEKDEYFGKAIILQVLPMTQGIYGLVAAMLLLVGSGFFGDGVAADGALGVVAITIGLVVGLTSISAIPQAQAASAGIASIPRNPDSAGKSVILAAMPETMAIFGLLVAIILMLGVGIL
jgi:V/A-type H+-transporting ATPase subunit K